MGKPYRRPLYLPLVKSRLSPVLVQPEQTAPAEVDPHNIVIEHFADLTRLSARTRRQPAALSRVRAGAKVTHG